MLWIPQFHRAFGRVVEIIVSDNPFRILPRAHLQSFKLNYLLDDSNQPGLRYYGKRPSIYSLPIDFDRPVTYLINVTKPAKSKIGHVFALTGQIRRV